MLDVKQLATHAMAAAYFADAVSSLTIDVGAWKSEIVQEWLDYLLAQAAEHKRGIKGIRTDNAGFAKLGIERDTLNSGMYKGVRS